MNKKNALITGIHGQDGCYLAELLLSKNYRVFGITRNTNLVSDKKGLDINSNGLCHSREGGNDNNRGDENSHDGSHSYKINYLLGDLTDAASIQAAIDYAKPDEIYNLASQSHAHKSWHQSLDTAEVNAIGAHRLFDIAFKTNPDCKIFQASSSQMFGDTKQGYQNEESPYSPNNPYAISKLYAHNIAKSYRNNYHRFISCGILYNHESPKRGMHFITQKVTYAAACIKHGIHQSSLLNEQGEPIINHGKLLLGNLDAIRDWGHAADFVKAMWLMLQHETPEDFIIATGINHSIRDLCEIAFTHVGLDWKQYIEIDQRFIRAQEITATADISKIKNKLSWTPHVTFNQLISSMVDFHLSTIESGEVAC